MHNKLQNVYFTDRVPSYSYPVTYLSGLVIIIPDKTTISAVSWHQMDTWLTQFVLDTRLVLETRLIFETQLLLEYFTSTPGLY